MRTAGIPGFDIWREELRTIYVPPETESLEVIVDSPGRVNYFPVRQKRVMGAVEKRFRSQKLLTGTKSFLNWCGQFQELIEAICPMS